MPRLSMKYVDTRSKLILRDMYSREDLTKYVETSLNSSTDNQKSASKLRRALGDNLLQLLVYNGISSDRVYELLINWPIEDIGTGGVNWKDDYVMVNLIGCMHQANLADKLERMGANNVTMQFPIQGMRVDVWAYCNALKEKLKFVSLDTGKDEEKKLPDGVQVFEAKVASKLGYIWVDGVSEKDEHFSKQMERLAERFVNPFSPAYVNIYINNDTFVPPEIRAEIKEILNQQAKKYGVEKIEGSGINIIRSVEDRADIFDELENLKFDFDRMVRKDPQEYFKNVRRSSVNDQMRYLLLNFKSKTVKFKDIEQ